jgi:hypothetical protein
MKIFSLDSLKPTDENWETCSLHILLARIVRLNQALSFCKGRAAGVREPVSKERDRLIDVYTRRVREQRHSGK